MTQSVKTQAILQARVGSTRLEGKILEPIGDRPLLGWIVDRLRAVKLIDRIVIATTTNTEDEKVAEFASQEGLPCVRGSEEDVLGRYINALDQYPAETVIRATGDNPLTDPGTIDLLFAAHLKQGADYTGPEGVYPIGLFAEVVSAKALRKAHAESSGPAYRENVTTYIHSHPEKFIINRIGPPDYLTGRDYRLTVDTDADLLLMRTLCDRLQKAGKEFNARNAVSLLDSDPELLNINSHIRQKNWRRDR